ncbi:MAG: DNA translocase FtsK [Firmicutes bacterium]|jgi:S-DNA-T family DNA segregation ATPase FtsK/SpoIIIE|nr:DNA translocase FtsK [Bacillota bacterium]
MRSKKGLNMEIKSQIRGILMIALAVFCYTGLQFTEQTGTLGQFVNNVLRILAGETAIVIPFIVGVVALRSIIPEKTINMKTRLVGVLLLLLLFTVTYHLDFMLNQVDILDVEEGFLKASFRLGYQHEGGGLVGALFTVILYYCFGEVASYIVIVTLALIGILLIMNVSLTQLFAQIKALGKFLIKAAKFIGKIFKDLYNVLVVGPDMDEIPDKTKNEKTDRELPVQEEEAIVFPHRAAEMSDMDMPPKSEVEKPLYRAEDIAQQKRDTGEIDEYIPAEDKIILDPSGEYNLPSLDLLSKSTGVVDHSQDRHIKERARLLENTLHSFGVGAKVINYESGPTVTRFEVQPEVGVKVSKILNLSDDIALNLAAPVVRIEAPIPGKAALGIEVPNKVISLVHFREVMESSAFQSSLSPLTIALGKDITGVPVITSLERMPHLLIAGATGSGKSVCLNIIICSILFKARPDQVRFLMIDPKMVELNIYNGIPHLIAPVVTDPKKASLALKNMIKEMIKRYDLFAQEGVRDISAYNERVARGQVEADVLPYIVVIIDELADLMLISPSEVEDSIARLAQMSRAAGIHLVIATQRPSVDVLTGVIKANITSRIAFTVSSQVDSRTILDMAGAEKLLGRGDMLFYPVGMVKPLRVQNAFISSKDLKSLTRFIKKQDRDNKYGEEMVFTPMPEDETWDDVDVLFPDAVELVVRTGQASISLLQRRLRIGYTRAARLIDDLEVKGVVGPHEGSKPREVIITPEQASRLYEEFKQKLS